MNTNTNQYKHSNIITDSIKPVIISARTWLVSMYTLTLFCIKHLRLVAP